MQKYTISCEKCHKNICAFNKVNNNVSHWNRKLARARLVARARPNEAVSTNSW